MFKCYLLRTVEVALNPVPPSCTPIRALLRKRLFNSHSSLPRFKFPMPRIIPQGLSHGCQEGEGGISTASALVMSSPTPSLWASPWLWALSPSPLLLPEQKLL